MKPLTGREWSTPATDQLKGLVADPTSQPLRLDMVVTATGGDGVHQVALSDGGTDVAGRLVSLGAAAVDSGTGEGTGR